MLFNANVVDNDLHLRALQQTHFRNGKVACEHSEKNVPLNEKICSYIFFKNAFDKRLKIPCNQLLKNSIYS